MVNGNLGYPQKTLTVPVVVVLTVCCLSWLNLFKYFFMFYSGPYNTVFAWFKNFQQFLSKVLLRRLWCFCHVQWQSMKWPLYYVLLVSTFQPCIIIPMHWQLIRKEIYCLRQYYKSIKWFNIFKSNFKVLFLNKCCFIFKFIFIKMTEMG